jgi:hypothetical protein
MKAKAKAAVDPLHQPQHTQNLILNLIRRHEDVGIVLVKRADPEEAGLSTPLISCRWTRPTSAARTGKSR